MPSIWPWGALGGALGGFAPPLDIGCRWSVRSSPQYQGCSKVGRCQPKSEGRKPKSEGSPKSEVPKDWPRWRLVRSAAEVLLRFRASDFKAACAVFAAIARTLEQPCPAGFQAGIRLVFPRRGITCR